MGLHFVGVNSALKEWNRSKTEFGKFVGENNSELEGRVEVYTTSEKKIKTAPEAKKWIHRHWNQLVKTKRLTLALNRYHELRKSEIKERK